MTTDDSRAVPDTETMPDLLAALQASIDRARGRGRSDDDRAVPDAEPTRTWDDAVAEIPASLRADADVLVRWVTLHGGEPMHALSRLLRLLARDVPAGRDLTERDVAEAFDRWHHSEDPADDDRAADFLNRIMRGDRR